MRGEHMGEKQNVSLAAYRRLTQYWQHLKALGKDPPPNISSTDIARKLGINDVVVRKDLAMVSGGGKPRLGYDYARLFAEIESFLGYDNVSDAVLVGVGRLGQALLHYKNFKHYGFRIAAAFDKDKSLIGSIMAGLEIRNIDTLAEFTKRVNIHIGIITAGAEAAQSIADALVEGGVRGIWNFAPVKLNVPDNIVVRTEDMAASLAILTAQISGKNRISTEE